MSGPIHAPQQNHLLVALSAEEQERLYPHLRLVPMSLGKVLYESGDLLRHVYFPTDSIVSLLYVLADGASAEISVVGNDGLIGIALFMGGETTPSRAIVQSEQLGVSLVSVMHTQSREVRLSRRRAAEAEALRAPVKMLIPLVVFILPTLFMLLLGPVGLRAAAALGGLP